MLHHFLANNREDLIERCRLKVAHRPGRSATAEQLRNGVPLFLDQLIQTLRVEQTAQPMESRSISGPSGGETAFSAMGRSATQHGRQLLESGFSIDQVVHDYGDLCQAITDLAYERDAPFQVDEFRTLNRCLDNAIAGAVTEFSYQRDSAMAEKHAVEMNERMGFLAHELRNFLQTATLAFAAAKAGNLNLAGATGTVLERSLIGLRKLIDHSLAEVQSNAAGPAKPQIFPLSSLVDDLIQAADLAAQARGCHLKASTIDPGLAIRGNRDLLYSALANLLQNAFKFTQPGTDVRLNAYAAADRILIDVADHCGGLSASNMENMFRPFQQNDADRTGIGLGLSIARRSVEANDGLLSVRNVPDVGCVFTISLPRHTMPKA